MLWFRIHRGSNQLDDARRSGQAPSDRRGTQEIHQNSRVSEQEQATLSHSVEKITQGSGAHSTGKTIHPHCSIHGVRSPLDSRSPCSICPTPRLAIPSRSIYQGYFLYELSSIFHLFAALAQIFIRISNSASFLSCASDSIVVLHYILISFIRPVESVYCYILLNALYWTGGNYLHVLIL